MGHPRLAILTFFALGPISGHTRAAGATLTIITIPGSPPPRTHAPRPEATDETKREMRLSPLVAEALPPVVAMGVIVVGRPILQIAVRHRFTGSLAADVVADGWIGFGARLPAGTPVYGIPMGGPDGPGVVWCAPRRGTSGGGKWAAVCLPFGDKATVWALGHPAMFAIDLKWDDTQAREADTPTVARGPVPFPPMTFSYAFGGWDARGWLIILERLDWGEGAQTLRSLSLPPNAAGETHLQLMGGEFSLRAPPALAKGAPAQVSIIVISPPVPGAPIVF